MAIKSSCLLPFKPKSLGAQISIHTHLVGGINPDAYSTGNYNPHLELVL